MATNDPFLDALQREYLGGNPEAAFNYVFPMAMQNNPYGNWLRGSQGRYLGGYQAAVAGDPSLNLVDYLKGMSPYQEFLNMAPSQRGENPGLYAPKVQFKYGAGY